MEADLPVLTAPTDPVTILALQVPQALLEHLAVQAHPDLPEYPDLPDHPALPADLVAQGDRVAPMDLMVPAAQVIINVSKLFQYFYEVPGIKYYYKLFG